MQNRLTLLLVYLLADVFGKLRPLSQVRVLLQALARSFMSNAAAVQGLSSALAPPTSGTGGAGPQGRNVGGNAGGSAGSSSSSGGLTQHSVSVSLGKAWLEILVRLMRRADGGNPDLDSTNTEGSVPFGGAAAATGAVVIAALEDSSTRDSLLVLFERTAAGLAAAATAAAVAATSVSGVGGACAPMAEELGGVVGVKAPAWADQALVLRLLVLLREVLVRAPDAYVVPLRRRGVLHG